MVRLYYAKLGGRLLFIVGDQMLASRPHGDSVTFSGNANSLILPIGKKIESELSALLKDTTCKAFTTLVGREQL